MSDKELDSAIEWFGKRTVPMPGARNMPGTKAVSLHDIYRVISGHSYYHGDRILAALTCIAEGKEVNPVRPADVAPVVRCRDCKNWGYGVAFCGFEMRDDVPKCWETYEPTSADDFCSYGERKD